MQLLPDSLQTIHDHDQTKVTFWLFCQVYLATDTQTGIRFLMALPMMQVTIVPTMASWRRWYFLQSGQILTSPGPNIWEMWRMVKKMSMKNHWLGVVTYHNPS